MHVLNKLNVQTKALLESHMLIPPEMTIGRHFLSNILETAGDVSRKHALLQFKQGSWGIVDVSETTGVFVNKVLISKGEFYPLTEGDKITLKKTSETEFVFQVKKSHAEKRKLSEVGSYFTRSKRAKKSNCLSTKKETATNTENAVETIVPELYGNHAASYEDKTIQGKKNEDPDDVKKKSSKKRKMSNCNTIDSGINNSPKKLPVRRCLHPFMKKEEQATEITTAAHHGSYVELTTEQLQDQLEKVHEELQTERSEKIIAIEQQKRSSIERKKIKNTHQELVESELICIICTEIIVKAATLPCGHSFCSYCLSRWLQAKKFCPLCRHVYWGTPAKTLMVDNTVVKVLENLNPEIKKRYLEVKEEREKEESSKPVAAPSSYDPFDDDTEIPPLDVRVRAAIMAEQSPSLAGPSRATTSWFQSSSASGESSQNIAHRPCNFCGSHGHLEENCERRDTIYEE